jgi:hypothetical protein
VAAADCGAAGMAFKLQMCMSFALVAIVLHQVQAQCEDETCGVTDAQHPIQSSALLQVQMKENTWPAYWYAKLMKDSPAPGEKDALLGIDKSVDPGPNRAMLGFDKAKSVDPGPNRAMLGFDKARQCSWSLQAGEDGSRPCEQLKDRNYISGREAPLDEAGYKQTATLCCHHEMSLFIRREIASQGLTVCDLSDLHGFVHWYDCTNDKYTFAELKAEIASVAEKPCPWLGHVDKCPAKGVNCFDFPPCPPVPAGSLAGDTAPMTEAGYAGVAKRCCHGEMEKYVRREIDNQGLSVCDEGGLQGFLHWFDCTDDNQSYQKLKEGIVMARSGLPPLCPWLGTAGEPCPPKGHNCPVVEVAEPAAHRRRTACR